MKLRCEVTQDQYLLKINTRNTSARCEICSKLTKMASFWSLTGYIEKST